MNSVFSLVLMKNKSYNNIKLFNRSYSFTSFDLVSRYDGKTQKFRNVYPLIYDHKNLEQAWQEIKNSQNNGHCNNDFKSNWFQEVSKKLESNTYSYHTARKVLIPKSKTSSKKALTISNLKDKVIQRAFLRILQPIYEGVTFWSTVSYKEYKEYQNFSKTVEKNCRKICSVEGKKVYQIKKWAIKTIFNEDSFGFRPNRSPHLVLKKIKRVWNPLIWFWSVDLIKVFGNINYHRLINEIEKTIDDQKFINELWKMFKTKTIVFFNKEKPDLNIFQDSILSPFLFNVLMTPLDYFVKRLKANCEKTVFSLNKTKFFSGKSVDSENLKNMPKFEITDEPIHIYYIRYLDHLIFGFNMDKQLARTVTTKIVNFIKSDLHLDFQKSNVNTKLIHARSEFIQFLGFQIGCYPSKLSAKSTHLVRFSKLKANIQRKRVAESEAYFKLIEGVFARHHRQTINSIRTHGQTLIKRSQIKQVNNHRIKIKVINALKKSLSSIESEIIMSSIKSHLPKSKRGNTKYNSSLEIAEQKRLNLLKIATQKWIQKAIDLANKEDEIEIKNLAGEYLSPRFIKIREIYLKELEKLSYNNYNKEIVKENLKKVQIQRGQNSIFEGMLPKTKIRILFPVKEIKKKLRSLGLIHKVITRPIGINYLTSQKDHDIINWYDKKANALWNYYCCSDNVSELKKVLNWLLRYSLLGTLASKYKSSIKQMIHQYSLAPKVNYIYQKKNNECIDTIARYPSKEYFNKKKKLFSKNSLSPIELEIILKSKINTFFANPIINYKCGIASCKNNAEEIYHLKELDFKFWDDYTFNFANHRIKNWKMNESILKSKQVFLCKNCYYKAYQNKLLPNGFDSKFVVLLKKEV